MPHSNSTLLARERARGMRPDAHHFIRSDWRRFVRPGYEREFPFDIYERYERKYRPDQPRVPAGNPDGGEWTRDGDGGDTQIQSADSKKSNGYHLVPKGVYDKLPLQPETKKVFAERTTGMLQDPKSNQYDHAHRAYNAAVSQELDHFMKEKGVTPDQMTPDQAREFVDRVISSRNPAIRTLNMRIYMREIMRGLWRRSRGGE